MKRSQTLKSRHSLLSRFLRSSGLLIAVAVALSALTAAAPERADAAPDRSVSIIVTSNPFNPSLDGAVPVGGRPWAIAIIL